MKNFLAVRGPRSRDKAASRVSPHDHDVADRIVRRTLECVAPAIIEDQRNRPSEVLLSRSRCPALPVGARDLRAGPDEPGAVTLDDRCDLVPHHPTLITQPGSGRRIAGQAGQFRPAAGRGRGTPGS